MKEYIQLIIGFVCGLIVGISVTYLLTPSCNKQSANSTGEIIRYVDRVIEKVDNMENKSEDCKNVLNFDLSICVQ